MKATATAAAAAAATTVLLPRLPNGQRLQLIQVAAENGGGGGVLGGRVWPAASAMCRFLLSSRMMAAAEGEKKNKGGQESGQFQHYRNVLELGSGTGAVGIFAAAAAVLAAASLSQHEETKSKKKIMILTDHRPPMRSVMTSVPYHVDGTLDLDLGNDDVHSTSDRLLRLLQQNVDINRHLFQGGVAAIPQVHELDWTQRQEHIPRLLAETFCVSDSLESNNHGGGSGSGGGFDCLLASDVTYFTQLHDDLAETIAALLLRSPSSSPRRTNDDDDDDDDDPLATRTTPTPTPTCFLAHQPRVFNLRGHDAQLESFRQSLDRAGLLVAATHRVASYNDARNNDDDGDSSNDRGPHLWLNPTSSSFSSNDVLILAIQHNLVQ